MDQDRCLRTHLINLLDSKSAHITFKKVLKDIPPAFRGMKTAQLPYTIWEQLEHIRIAQWDILEFSRNAKHVSPIFPAGYWPVAEAPEDEAAWSKSLECFNRNLQEIIALVGNHSVDLFERIPHGSGQTILREVLLLADHNAYHLGQIVVLRKILGAWSD